MYSDSKEIKQYLPYLPALTQNYLIRRLLGHMLSPESIIAPDVRTLLFYFTLSKKIRLPEYNTLMLLFNQDNQMILCHLLAQSHESGTFIQDFFDIVYVIFLNQPKHTMRFLINCTCHHPTWDMLTYPQYFLPLAESFVHRIPDCYRILISALASSLTWPMNEQMLAEDPDTALRSIRLWISFLALRDSTA